MADERSSGGDAAGYLGWFFMGALLGAAAALLLTPRTGQEARGLLREKGGDFAKRAQEYAKEAQVQAGELFEKGRELFEEQSQRLMSAFEAGKEAMKEEIGKARHESQRGVAEVELPNPEELEEKAERSFSRRVALVTAVYAVVLAIASLGGNNAMKEMLLAQQQSSDQWAFYQAKVIREHQYRAQKMRLEAEKRYNAEKKDIEKEAKTLEHERDRNRDKDPYFDYAEVLLQIAIVMASVSILSTSRPMFFFSLALALGGALLTVNGFTLFFRVPFLHH